MQDTSHSLEAERQISKSYSQFCGILRLADESLAAGDLEAAAGLAHLAARFAFPATVGVLASPHLERILTEVGRRMRPTPNQATKPARRGRRHVLHVLSYGKPVGGDSRYAWRWIQAEPGSRHSVAITTQADVADTYEIPGVLREAAERSGGFLCTLKAPISKPLEQSAELRALCQDADVVVLHLYPYDIIPVMALAAGCEGSKTIFVHHSDHTFWLGASVAHGVVHLRNQSPEFLSHRRGLVSEYSTILPIPLSPANLELSREEAKRALGCAPNTILLVTIASPFKYSAPGRLGFLELVAPVIERHQEAILVAIGPKPSGDWQAASVRTGGRIIPFGTRWDTKLLYAAADIYLDSIPFASITSLLEAGSQGAPLLGYRTPGEGMTLLGPGAPGLDESMIVAEDPEAYQRALVRLITDEAWRRERGARLQRDILSLHTGKNWAEAVSAAYQCAERSDRRGCLETNDEMFEVSALDIALGQMYPEANVGQLISKYIGALPYRSRLRLTWRLHKLGFGFCFSNLMPTPVRAAARQARRLSKRSIWMKPKNHVNPSLGWSSLADIAGSGSAK